MTYAANYLVTLDGIGAGGFAPGEFATIAEAIEAGMAEQDRAAAAGGYTPQWIMVEDEDRNVVADCTREQIDAIRSGHQNPVDLARFHVEGPDFYRAPCPF
jgi:hypothetical protein